VIILVEAGDRVLAAYPPSRSASAKRQLEKLGVQVRLDTLVTAIDEHGVTVKVGKGEAAHEERIAARTVLWSAGVITSSFARVVAEATGAQTDRAGRVIVDELLNVPGHPEIFVVGDAAVEPWKSDRNTPGVAQGAMQGGIHAAKTIRRRILGRPTEPFRYSNHGDVAVIGRLAGVTDIPWLGPLGQQSGLPAWFLWLLIHIAYLIGFANRIVVLTRWAFSFFTHGRGSRLITGQTLLPPIVEPEPPVIAADQDDDLEAEVAEDGRPSTPETETATAG
jgi:NADH dehydrogenase